MVKSSRVARFSTKIVDVILTQTDTTVGFLSQDEAKLRAIKNRDSSKPFIKAYADFKSFKRDGNRVPNAQKSRVRRSRKTTFVIKSVAFRIAKRELDSSFLNDRWNYSTSANESGKKFDREFCESKADIIIENKESLREGEPSSLFKINSKKRRRLR